MEVYVSDVYIKMYFAYCMYIHMYIQYKYIYKLNFSMSTPWRRIGRVEVMFHSFLKSTLHRSEWWTSRPDSFNLRGKGSRKALNRKLREHQSISGHFREEKISYPSRQFVNIMYSSAVYFCYRIFMRLRTLRLVVVSSSQKFFIYFLLTETSASKILTLCFCMLWECTCL